MNNQKKLAALIAPPDVLIRFRSTGTWDPIQVISAEHGQVIQPLLPLPQSARTCAQHFGVFVGHFAGFNGLCSSFDVIGDAHKSNL